ncbi:YXWGXW repeat-containing protein [Pedosphaera parvula]|uniref:Putative lipoprotein n=1 Tax=Pedosphaera parvula (strain Ellin514) TaxID=320771 RepID=B9XDK9_PEDPL|nr:YXWGXW repeat-containing protein [Pedosphaera parvula]EEF62155.1 putative lipoprotein [Pedosphaera parvula Ellin514]
MRKFVNISPLILVCTFTVLTGCVTREVVVRENAAPPPPAAVVEERGFRPYPTAEWVPGHYIWRHNRWVWVRGFWR